jgi:arylsulfatase A-like enzyme
VDEGVDALVGALRASGRLENTLIVFASDNGFLWGEHRLPYRKSSPYEESVRIPLVVRWDRAVPGPRSDASVVGNVDLAPTFAAAAGVEAPGSEGASLLPLLRGAGAPWRKEILLEHLRGTEGYEREVPTYCGVRSPRWKYVAYQTREEELYDLRRDPLELDSLDGSRRHRDELTALRRLERRLESCRGAECAVRPAVDLKARCAGRGARLLVAGRAAEQAASARFLLPGRDRTDSRGRLSARLRGHALERAARKGARANVEMLDGRIVTVSAGVPRRC